MSCKVVALEETKRRGGETQRRVAMALRVVSMTEAFGNVVQDWVNVGGVDS
jgi:hypothetical protein